MDKNQVVFEELTKEAQEELSNGKEEGVDQVCLIQN